MPTNTELLQQLADRRASGELSPYPLDPNFLWQLNEAERALRRSHLKHETGTQAVVLSREDMDVLGAITIAHVSGEEMTIEAESVAPGNSLVIFPEELAE